MRLFSTPAWAIAAGCLLLSGGAANAQTSTRGVLQVDGGKLAYETCGAGPKAVVLLHDGILHSAVFDDVWPKLCARFRVVRYDRRGYGASPPTAAPYTPATDLVALMKALDLRHATLVGSSSGSGIAVDFALAHPQTVDKLVLVGPWISGFDASWGFLFRTLALGLKAKMGDLEGAARDPYILTKTADAERARVVAWLKANPGNLAAGMRERPLAVAKPRLGEIRVPTLILVGAVDIKDVQEQAKVLETAIPGARRVVVPDSGHLLYLEQPQVFADLVTSFVEAGGR
ncbi:alpha/beta fold hydrolase [Caulobacter sp.]|uniref:alpha/beta fold hydrolase n=1 Tax=Caulobacter sp. TaxID=78 RepID=UPI003BAF6EF7